MRAHWRGLALASIAVGFCLALSAPAQARCVLLSGTADGFDKETAVGRAQSALAEEVKQYKVTKRLGAVTVSDARIAQPLLARQRQQQHALLQRLVRHLQARHREEELLHNVLVGSGLALCVYVRGQTLLVIR